MNQIERIKYMENIFDESKNVVAELSADLERYLEIAPRMNELIEYYEGRQWLQDFVDDSLGKVPKDLKRGVLSEDAVYDLLTENVELLKKLNLLKTDNMNHIM